MAEQVSIEDLRATDVFAGLSDDSLGQIAKLCTQRAYQAGEYCAVQGETTDQMLIVDRGKVAIEMRIEAGAHTHALTIATLTKGKVCAWSALVPPHVLTASVKCIERTQTINIKASDLQRMFEERPAIESTVMRNLAGVISSRLIESRTQLIRLIAELIKGAK